MDAVSNVPKRNALAEHLKEVVDTLEQKVRCSHSVSDKLLTRAYTTFRVTRLHLYMNFYRLRTNLMKEETPDRTVTVDSQVKEFPICAPHNTLVTTLFEFLPRILTVLFAIHCTFPSACILHDIHYYKSNV